MAEPTHISSYHDRDLDRAVAEGGHGLATNSLEMLDRESSYDVRGAEVVLGPLSVGRLQCAAALRATASDIQTCYAVDLPGAGVRQTEHRSASTEAFRGRGVICQPVGDIRMRLGDGYSCFTVRIDREALEDALLELLDRAPGHPPDPQPSVNLRAPAGARWARLVSLMGAAARSGALANPLVAAPLRDAVVRGMLVAADHRDRDGMERPIRTWCLGPVHRAVETMHDRPELPYTPTLLAHTVGVGQRALREGFLRHVGWPPMTYLRRVRLERVHDELRDGSPDETSVTETARRWGFADSDRFAELYLRIYRRTPGETLRPQRPVTARYGESGP